jgi:hypothetical protein
MKKTELEMKMEQSITELNDSLLELRDGLNVLSLALKDWQFNYDIEKRGAANEELTQLLQRVTSVQHRDP